MKRIVAFVIGICVAVLVSVAHARGWLGLAETPLHEWAQRGDFPPRIVGNLWQDIFVTLIALAVSWLTLISATRRRIVWLVLAFMAELLVLAWIASLYHVFFQPVPSILAAAFAYAASIVYLAWDARPRAPKPEPVEESEPVRAAAPLPEPVFAPLPQRAPEPLPKRVAEPLPTRVTQPVMSPISQPLPQSAPRPAPAPAPMPVAPSPAPVPAPAPAPGAAARPAPMTPFPPPKPQPEPAVAGAPEMFEATVLACDLPTKYDLLDNLEPAAAARAVVKFGQSASELLLKAGAHLHKVDGEGLVALFGFPQPMPEHAEKAVRAAFELVRALADETHGSNGDSAPPGGAHVGISSGAIIAGRVEGSNLVLGEAIELARRFCLANRFYGSRILIGPETFEMATNGVVARPIDFLSGVTAQERHEIYEPLALAAEAPAELLARRDSFWKGVVLYREKRWVEALAEFQKARSDAEADDPPLNLYLRRLEPLALHFIESGRE